MQKLIVSLCIIVLLCVRCASKYEKLVEKAKKSNIENANFKQALTVKEHCGIYLVKVNIDGKALNFVIATEYATSGVRLDVAKKLEFLPDGKNIIVPKIDLEGIIFNDVIFNVYNFDHRKFPCIDEEVHGVIGSNMMEKMVWQFDNPNKRVWVASHIDSFSAMSRKTSFFFHVANRLNKVPFLNFRLNKNFLNNAYLATGKLYGIHLPKAQVESISDTTLFIRSTHFLRDKDSIIGTQVSRSPLLKGLTFDMAMPLDSVKLTATNQRSGYIGNGFLNDYIVTIDWKTYKIAFSEKKKTPPKNISHGFYFSRENNKAIIHSLYMDSAAAEAGIAVGDEILSIGEVDLTTMTDDEFKIWAQKNNNNLDIPEKTTYKIKNKGTIRTISLQKFDKNSLWRKNN
jgi:PDZ domain